MSNYPEGLNVSQFSRHVGDDVRDYEPSVADRDDIAVLLAAIQGAKTLRTLLRGLPALATKRSDIYSPVDLDCELETGVSQMQEAVALLISGAE